MNKLLIYFSYSILNNEKVNHIVKKLNKSLYCIKMAKRNLNYKGLRALYFALIHSHLSYCPIILNCLPKSKLNKIFKIQKKAIRIITNSRYNDHTGPLFSSHKILPLEKIIKQAILTFMHSVAYDYAPKSFDGIWIKNNNRERDFNLRNDDDFHVPVPRIDFYKKMPTFSLPNEWNNSGILKFYQNRIAYKFALRDQLFTELAS